MFQMSHDFWAWSIKFCPHVADMKQPLRDLLKKGGARLWGNNQQQPMKKLKATLASNTILALNDPGKETAVSADAAIATV